MFRLFKSTRVMYAILCVISIAFTCCLFSYSEFSKDGVITYKKTFPFSILIENELLLDIAFFMVLGTLCTFSVFLVNKIAGKKYKVIKSLLFDKCDPEKYIEINNSFVSIRYLDKYIRKTIQSNLALGCYSRGDFQISIDIESSLLLSGKKQRIVETNLIHMINICNSYLAIPDLINSRNYLERIKLYKQNLLPSEKNYTQYKRAILRLESKLKIFKGEHIDALGFFWVIFLIVKIITKELLIIFTWQVFMKKWVTY